MLAGQVGFAELPDTSLQLAVQTAHQADAATEASAWRASLVQEVDAAAKALWSVGGRGGRDGGGSGGDGGGRSTGVGSGGSGGESFVCWGGGSWDSSSCSGCE